MTQSKRHWRRWKTTKGSTITELLVSSLLIGFAMATLGEIMMLLTLQASKNNNRWTAMDAARLAVQRVASEVRSASAFGDTYAKPGSNERLQFPASDNPIYATNGISICKLSAQTLIIQSPTFYLDERNHLGGDNYQKEIAQNPYNAIPLKIGKLDTASVPLADRDFDLNNMDTVIYQVVADDAVPGSWKLQRAFYPGARIQNLPTDAPMANKKILDPPQIVATGIVGPFSKSGDPAPSVFSYFSKNKITGKVQKSTSTIFLDQDVDLLQGIGVDMEILKPNTAGGGARPERLGIHHESFLRANRLMPRLNYRGLKAGI